MASRGRVCTEVYGGGGVKRERESGVEGHQRLMTRFGKREQSEKIIGDGTERRDAKTRELIEQEP